MMQTQTYFIPIDRSTFRNNPRAGETQTVVPTAIEFTVNVNAANHQEEWRSISTVKFRHFDQNGEHVCVEGDFVLVRCTSRNGSWPAKMGEPVHRVFRNNSGVEIVPLVYIHRCNHLPLPRWLFDYAPAEVQCSNCGARFDHTKLSSDSYDDGDGDDIHVQNICPNCESAGCCDVEYERPEAVAAELGLS